MSERETTTFTTPAGHVLRVYTYITGKEAAEVKALMMSKFKMSMEDAETGKVGIGEISGEFLAEQETKTLELLIVSIDGITEKPVEELLDLPSTEYDFVKAELEKITNPSTPSKSETPGEGTSSTAQ
jgi:hypothetical protein